jgi:hypothetical protein
MPGPDRRRFLAQVLGGSAATLAAPSWLGAMTRPSDGEGWPDPFSTIRRDPGPDPLGQAVPDEAYWERVRIGESRTLPGPEAIVGM